MLYEYIEIRITTENPLDFNLKKALILRRNKTAEHLIYRQKTAWKKRKNHIESSR